MIVGVLLYYRPEIDGLRALAVAPVILFHANIAGFSGGFVGVDIFFVISGYLITSIILADIEKERFTFRNFYARRAKRILPALIAVIIATLVVGWFWLPPGKFSELGISAIAALFSVSNIYFWKQAGYFSEAAENQPLLHTWSLGVEEQFYLFFPIAVLLLFRFGNRSFVTVALTIVGAVSFALCEWAWRNTPDANFYLAPTRAWELMAGALCAMYLSNNKHVGNDLLAMLGIAMLVASVLFYSSETPFPSYATLLPVLGTVLIILWASKETIVARLLSVKPMVGLGLVSYSAYLWHQPLFAFAKARFIDHPPVTVMLGLSILSIVLAVASWRFIEQPFRRPSGTKKQGAAIFGLGTIAASFSAVALASILIFANSGVPSRFDATGQERLASYRKIPSTLGYCKLGYFEIEPIVCEHGEREKPKARIALVGDSHASQWAEAIGAAGELNGWAVDTYAKSACPIANVEFTLLALRREYHECEAWRDETFERLRQAKYDLVIITHSTLSYTKFNGSSNVPYRRWEAGFSETAANLDEMPGKWLLLSDNPQFRERIPQDCLAKTMILNIGSPQQCTHSRSEALDDEARSIERTVVSRSVKGSWGDISDYFCDADRCWPEHEEIPIMYDSNHLTSYGAHQSVDRILTMIKTSIGNSDA